MNTTIVHTTVITDASVYTIGIIYASVAIYVAAYIIVHVHSHWRGGMMIRIGVGNPDSGILRVHPLHHVLMHVLLLRWF
jgi:hypothetical protein